MSENYKYGFVTDIENEAFEKGLNEDIIRRASALRGEPQFMLDFRLRAYEKLKTMEQPNWGELHFNPVDLQDIVYYSAPKTKKSHEKIEDVDPELLATFEKLGIPLDEQKRLANVAVDAVFDSVSIYTSHKKKLMEMGIIFCSISDAIKEYPELIEEYLGSVVPAGDNYFAALNSAVFGDGSFVYIPPGVKCPMDLSTYFRINNKEAGQFERTLIIADDDASVSYLEGCTAPEFSSKQLHSAIVELVAKENASIKYSTVQNWYAGDRETGAGGVYNFVTKRGKCAGKNSRISWTQVETGSAITWKYPSCILQGDNSVGEFYSVALTNGHMQADTGTKMIHIGRQEHQEHDHFEGHQRRLLQQRLPWRSEHPQVRYRRPQLHPVRQHARRYQERCPHVPVHHGRKRKRPDRARSYNQPHQRRSAILLREPRHQARRCHTSYGRWILQGRIQRIAR